MTNESKGMGKGLLIGILSGAAVGSVVTLLFAPKAGKKLREDIKTKSQDLIEDADKYISNTREKASKLFRKVKKKLGLSVGDVEENVESFIDESDKMVKNTKDKVGSHVRNSKVKIEKGRDRLKAAIKAGVKVYKIEKKS